ncbi:MAG: GTPase, partial [Candidatus Micrarchaeaceae archaeon]
MPYKDALEQRLDELREEYARTKYNKATDKHLGLLRARIAKTKREIEIRSRKKHGAGFGVKKAGDATVVLVGFPKAGKSSLLNALTGTESKVADYAFTTLDVIPGMLTYSGASIQLLDLPGIIEGAHLGRGEGTKIASIIRSADLLLIVIDATTPNQLDTVLDELYKLNIRVNKDKPNIAFEKSSRGGIIVEGAIEQASRKEIAEALIASGIYNANVAVLKRMPSDEIIDYLLENITYVKGIIAVNKSDIIGIDAAEKLANSISSKTGLIAVPVSAQNGTNLDMLKETLFSNSDLIRVYLKPKGSEADMKKPMIIKKGATVFGVAKKLNSKIAKYLKHAYITGPSSKFANQRVGIEHVMQDGDIATLVYEKH